MNDGCTRVKSNSTGNKSFSYYDVPGFPLVPAYRGITPEFYRVTERSSH